MNPLILMQNIAQHEHLLSLSVLYEGDIHSASLFYVYHHQEKHSLIVASSIETLHVKAALIHNQVSGTIAISTADISKIKGLQFKGIWQTSTAQEQEAYFKKFPYAIKYSPTIWSIQLITAKITDNESLGLGHKMVWTSSLIS